MDDEVHDRPSDVEIVEDNVAMKGPDGVSVVLTPDAAVETSERLFEAGVEAHGRRLDAERRARDRKALFRDGD